MRSVSFVFLFGYIPPLIYYLVADDIRHCGCISILFYEAEVHGNVHPNRPIVPNLLLFGVVLWSGYSLPFMSSVLLLTVSGES